MNPHDAHEEKRQLRFLLIISLIGIGLGIVGGILSKSLALIADVGHTVGDHLGLIVAMVAVFLSHRVPSWSRTVRRYAGKINTGILFVLPLWILYEAIHRLQHPHEIRAGWLTLFAVLGAGVNTLQLIVLGKCRCDIHLPLRAHVKSDLLMSVVLIGGSIAFALTGKQIIDPALSLIAAGFIWRLAFDTHHALHSTHPPHQH